MKRKTVLTLAAICIIVFIALVVFFSIYSQNRSGDIAFENDLALSEENAIQGKTRVEDLGVQKGDLFSYYLEVWYDSRKVAELDQATLEKSIHFDPFEIKNINVQEYNLGNHVRLYQREYILQLVTGKAGQLYEFPEMVIRYQPKGSDGLLPMSVSPEPVFVASRLGAEVRDLTFGYGPLRPIAAKILEVGKTIPWIFWGLGGSLVALGLVDLRRGQKAIPQRSTPNKERKSPEHLGEAYRAYRSLIENIAMAGEPKRLLHQMDHVLRVLLAQQEKIDWLTELNPETLPGEIRKPTAFLIELCRRAYSSKDVDVRDIEGGLRQLEEIFAFYFGQEEMAAWRDFQSL